MFRSLQPDTAEFVYGGQAAGQAAGQAVLTHTRIMTLLHDQ